MLQGKKEKNDEGIKYLQQNCSTEVIEANEFKENVQQANNKKD